MPFVLLGTPVAGGVVTHEYLHAVLALQQRFAARGWGLQVVTKPDGLVTRSRNALASAVARDARFTHLLMLDADVVVSPDGVERLLGAGHDVCGAVVPLRQVGWDRVRAHLDVVPDAAPEELRAVANEYAVNVLPGQRRVDGFVPVRAIGSAVLLVTRTALLELAGSGRAQPVARGLRASDGVGSGWAFFEPLVDEDGTYLSEDYAFCHRWRAAGGTVWADLRTPTRHAGPVALDGDVARSLAAATTASAARLRSAVAPPAG